MRQYIAATDKEYNRIEKHLCAPIFKKTFDCSKADGAYLEISASGFYRVFLNGQELTKGFFAPYISNPEHMICYDEYSLEDVLQEKRNELIVLLGNGFNNCNDNGIWDFEKASFRSAPKFYLAIYVDGEQILTTDESFEVYASPIVFDDIRCGEWYDARLEKQMWKNPRKPVLVAAPQGEYTKCTAQPICVEREITAKEILEGPDGYLYDFGENNTGICRLKIDGTEGQVIDLIFTELRDGANADMRSITFGKRSPEGYVQRERYICKEGMQEYTPSFTYYGFRYIHVQGITKAQAEKSLLTFMVVHSDIKSRAHFECDNKTINRIQECVIRSDISNFHYFPTDCPHREKNGWTGDVAVSAEQLCYNFDTYDSLRQWLHMVRNSQLESGEIPGIVPTTGWGYAWGNGIVWDDVLVELPYQLYRFHGKKEIVNENIEAIRRYLGYMKEKENEDGLFAYGLGDWCEAASVSEDACQTPLEVTASLTAIDLLEKAAFLFEVTGQDSHAEMAKEWQQKVRTAFRKKYVAEHTVNCLTQTAQAMALALDIFTTEEKDEAYRVLLELIRRDNSRFRVGIVGMKYLFDVLSEFGDSVLALKLIADPAFPSYGYLIDKGATTLWEAFHDYEIVEGRIERKDKNSHITSFNHHFFGSVSTWFYQRIAGLCVISATEVKIAPCLDCGLEWAEAEYHNEYGHIRISWKRDGESVILNVDNHGFKGCVEARFTCQEKVSVKLSEGIYSSVLRKP